MDQSSIKSSTSVEKNFNDLDECLVRIFKLFSLQDRLRLRIVCHSWEDAIIKTFQMQTTLKLFQSANHVEEYLKSLIKFNIIDDDYFKLGSSSIHNELVGNYRDEIWHPGNNTEMKLALETGQFGPEQTGFLCYDHHEQELAEEYPQISLPMPDCDFLLRLFPNIQKLVVSYSNECRVDLPKMLRNWAPTLTDLSLFKLPESFVFSDLHIEIAKAINLLTALTRLDVFCIIQLTPKLGKNYTFEEIMACAHSKSCKPPNFADELMLVLPRLEQLSVYDMSFLSPIYCRFGPNFNRLMLHHCELKDLSKLLQYKSHVVARMTHLSLSEKIGGRKENFLCGVDLDLLQFVCRHFVSLKSLSFMPHYSTKFGSILECLARLPSLTELKIYYYSNRFNYKDKRLSVSIDKNSVASFPVLRNIKVLHLNYSKLILKTKPKESKNAPSTSAANSSLFSSDDFFHCIARTFPCLEKFNITERCTKPEIIQAKKDWNLFAKSGTAALPEPFLTHISINEEAALFGGTHSKKFQEFKRNKRKFEEERDHPYTKFGCY